MNPYGSHVLAFALVMAIGFAAHRASLCTVKAVAEVITSGTGHMFMSFAKAVLWAIAISGAFALADGSGAAMAQRLPHGIALAGGFLFGVGAAFNGGCSLSTLQRLADGYLTMLATLIGMIAGILGWTYLDLRFVVSVVRTVPSNWRNLGVYAVPLMGLLGLWALWECARLWRGRDRGLALPARVAADSYRLSVASAILGIGAGLLYKLEGAWTYTGFLRGLSLSWLAAGTPPPASLGLFAAALLAGMVASSWQRGTFSLRWEGQRAGLRHFAAGLMMGVGGALIPGGNDTLILVAIPTLSPWALVTYFSLLAGVAAGLLLMRAVRGSLPRVACAADRCITP